MAKVIRATQNPTNLTKLGIRAIREQVDWAEISCGPGATISEVRAGGARLGRRIMTAHGFALFDTAIGACGIAWGERGLVGVQLPEASAARTGARVRRRCPGAREAPPPPSVQRAIEGIVALLGGEAIDLSAVALDMAGVPPFERRVYEVARAIPAGATLTYGEIAMRLGMPGEARAVGQALGQNPFPLVVPCHRVLAAGGKVGGFSANGGIATKLRLLSIERARTSAEPSLFDALPLVAAPRCRR